MSTSGGKLSGQVAWIGGGASGIGAAIAELFASEGATVAVVDIQAVEGTRLADRIRSTGARAEFFSADVGREGQVRKTMESVVERFGRLDIVVNCAGVVHVKLLHEYSEADWDELMTVNLKSIFFAIKHAFPHFKRQRRSYMVNVGSISTFTAQANTPAYATSKGAVLQLTKSIATDYAAYGLRCNCLCPGITDTPMLRYHLSTTADPEGVLRDRLERVPMGIVMKPGDIARSALYLCCEDSAGVTGTSVLVDGGYLATAEWHAPSHTAFMDPP